MNNKTDQKITQGLERISKAFRVLLWEESKLHKISPIQIQLLLFCATHKKEDLKVSFLAKEFDLTKPTISDSLKILIEKELLSKKANKKDSRSFTVQLTQKGTKIVAKTSSFTSALNQSVNTLSETEQGNLLSSLLHIIHELNQKEVISIQRMCLTCYHYKKEGNTHFCNLLEKPLKNTDLQVDCFDHKMTS